MGFVRILSDETRGEKFKMEASKLIVIITGSGDKCNCSLEPAILDSFHFQFGSTDSAATKSLVLNQTRVSTLRVSSFESQNLSFESESSSIESVKSSFESEKSSIESENSSFESESASFESEKSSFESEISSFDSESSSFQSEN